MRGIIFGILGRIEVNPNAESELLGDVKNDNAETSNVSLKTNNSNIFENIPTSESSGINGISFAQDLVFDGEGYVDNTDLKGGVIQSEQEPTEFIWGIVPDNKQYSVKLTFSNASNLKDIIVYGNKTGNQFPTRAIIDGTTEIFSDDYRWAINLQEEKDTHTIEFTHWNRENYNASLTFISVMMKYFEIDKRSGLKSVESLSQSTGQPKDIFYGIVPSSGSLEILDLDGEIADMVTDEIIPNSDLNVEIFANGKKVQHHTSSSSDYSRDRIFSVDMSNKLSNLQNLTYGGFKNEDITSEVKIECDSEYYDENTKIFTDLSFDSLSSVDLAMEIESVYNANVESAYSKDMTVKDLVEKLYHNNVDVKYLQNSKIVL